MQAGNGGHHNQESDNGRGKCRGPKSRLDNRVDIKEWFL